jgi:hypothetical protein
MVGGPSSIVDWLSPLLSKFELVLRSLLWTPFDYLVMRNSFEILLDGDSYLDMGLFLTD